MIDRADIRNSILKQLGEDLDKGTFDFEIIQSDDEINLDSLDNTLIACHATWSGPSIQMGKHMLEQIGEATKKKLKLLILDIDHVSVELQKNLFKTEGKWGYFETCWIENGQIVKTYRYKQELEPFIQYIIEKIENTAANKL